MRRAEEPKRLSRNARTVLRILRHEWEMATTDLRKEAGMADRATLIRALDELQAAMSRPEAGRGNRALVAEGFAASPARGCYHLATLKIGAPTL